MSTTLDRIEYTKKAAFNNATRLAKKTGLIVYIYCHHNCGYPEFELYPENQVDHSGFFRDPDYAIEPDGTIW